MNPASVILFSAFSLFLALRIVLLSLFLLEDSALDDGLDEDASDDIFAS